MSKKIGASSTETADELAQAKTIIRELMNELDANHFGAIHTLDPQHPNRAAHTRAAEFLNGR